MIPAPAPLRRRLALAGGTDATVSLRVVLRGAFEPVRFEAAACACVGRFDAFRLDVARVEGVSSPFVAAGAAPEVVFTWQPPLEPSVAADAGESVAAPSASRRNRVVFVVDRMRLDRPAVTISAPARFVDRGSLVIVMDRIVSMLREDRGAQSGEDSQDEVSYLRVAEWLHDLSQSVEGSRGKLFWRRAVPDDAVPRPSREPAARPVEIARTLEMPDAFRRLSPSRRESLAALTWMRLARVLSGNALLAIGCLADGRPEEDLREVVGPLSRFIPLTVRDEHTSVESAVESTAAYLAEARLWQEAFCLDDFGDLFQYCFEYDAGRESQPFEIETEQADADRFVHLLRCEERAGELRIVIRSSDPDADVVALQTLYERWLGLLTRCLERPETIVAHVDVLTPAERAMLPWHGTRVETAGTLHEAFAHACDAHADSIAVSCQGSEMTFATLDARANAFAALLPPLPAEAVVAIEADRSPDVLVAIFAVLKVGAAFLPLDPGLPDARRRQILGDAKVALVIGNRLDGEAGGCDAIELGVAVAAIRTARARRPRVRVHPDQLAYVLYTSGSSGVPVGAAVSHRSVLNLWKGLDEAIPELSAAKRVGMNGPISFDTSIKQMVQLLSGHTLVTIPEATRLDSTAFWAHANAEAIEIVDATPSHLARLLEPPALPRGLPRVVLLGGEPPPEPMWNSRAFERCYNLYGLTECTVDSLVGPTGGGAPAATLGRPLPNTAIALVDRAGVPVPDDVDGEILIAGLGVARGYVNAPARTAERFVPDAWGAGGRAFATADVARRRDGALRYVGRRFGVVKIGGRRVSLEQVRREIESHPGVAAAVVSARRLNGESGDRIVAWVVPVPASAMAVDGFARYAHDDLFVAGLNHHETAFLYGEVFGRQVYLRHGLFLPDEPCVFDVGANIGLFSLQAHLCSRGARIFAFEPSPEAYRCLRANARIFGVSGHFLNVGVGSRAGDAAFTAYDGFSLLSGFHADRDADLAVVREYVRQQQPQQEADAAALLEDLLATRFESRRAVRPVTTISDVVQEYGVAAIDLLKINVEKSEWEVLDGIRPEDWPKIRQVALEVHDVDGRLREILGMLERHGFGVTAEKDWSLPGPESQNYYVYASRHGIGATVPVVRRTDATLVAPLTSRDLKTWLTSRLAAHEIPARAIVIDRLPLNGHGKIDREALEAQLAESDRGDRPEPPRTALEGQLLAEWQQILETREVGVDTNFLEGGDSFSVMQLNLRLRRLLAVDLPIVDMFKHASIRALAAHLASRAPEPCVPDAAGTL